VSDAKSVRSFAGLAAGEAIARGIAFLASLVVARRLGPAMYGVIGVASGILLYLNQLADGGIELSGVPAVARQREGVGEVVSSTLTFRIILALVLTVIVVIVGTLFFPKPDGSILALYALGLVFVAGGTRWVFVGLQRTTWVAAARIGGELIALLIVLVAVREVGDVALVPIAAVLGVAISAVVMLVGLRAIGVRAVPRLHWETSRPLFERGPHLVGFTLLGLVLFNADLIYLRFVSGQAAAGNYAASYTFIAFAANLSVTWAHSVMPSMARFDKSDGRRNDVYETSMLLAYTVALPVAVGGILTARPLMDLVFGPEYLAAVSALIWLLPAVPVAAVREIAVVGLIGSPGGERKLVRINATCAAFNIAILLPVVPRFGLIGAAAVTVLTEVLRLVIAFHFARQEGFHPPRASRFVKPSLAAAAMVPVLVALGDRPLVMLLVAGVAVYAGLLVATGVLQIQRPFQVRVVV
jgi:O-antigen/teichoic acid export membrane protein